MTLTNTIDDAIFQRKMRIKYYVTSKYAASNEVTRAD